MSSSAVAQQARSAAGDDPGQDSARAQFRVPRRIVEGVAFLGAATLCWRYQPAAQEPLRIDTGTPVASASASSSAPLS
jgi:hypothetical protein